MKHALPCLLAVALLALAGCSKPPTGTITGGAPDIPATGVANNDYRAAVNPYNATPVGSQVCGVAPPPPAPQCIPPSSTIHLQFQPRGLPAPESLMYEAWLVGPAGAPVDIGMVMENATSGGFDRTYTAAENLDGRFDTIEVRLGDFVVATASAKGGLGNPFTVPNAILQTKVEGSYTGADLTLEVSGLPPTGPFSGRLYAPEGGAVVAQEEFDIAGNGQVQFHAKKNVNEYTEFHIHIKGTSINLLKTTVG